LNAEPHGADALISTKKLQEAGLLLKNYQGDSDSLHQQIVASKLEQVSNLLAPENIAPDKSKPDARPSAMSREKTKALYNKAKSYHTQNRYLKAIQALEAVRSRGAAGHEKRNAKKLIPEIEKQLEAFLEANYRQARAFFKAGDYTNTLVTVNRIAANSDSDYRGSHELARNSAQQLYRMGIVYESIGNYEKAKNFWSTIIEHYPFKKDRYYTRTLKIMEGKYVGEKN
jgi:tetratricopeptide (TPR) repeat protein